MQKVQCPACGKRYRLAAPQPGVSITCSCGVRFDVDLTMPPGATRADYRSDPPSVPDDRRSNAERTGPATKSADEKFCVECGEVIRARAAICPKCGVRQPGGGRRPTDEPIDPNANIRGTIRAVTMVSGVVNLVAAALYVASCIFSICAIPLAILAIVELKAVTSIDTLHPSQLKSQTRTLAIFEMIIGLLSLISLVCGVLNLINASSIVDELDDDD